MLQFSPSGVSFHCKLKLKNSLVGNGSNLVHQSSFHFNNILYNAYTVKRITKII